MSRVRVGTSGWNYPTGRGSWNGVFYPVGPGASKKKSGFDELSFYAEHFETVEVNSSFYGVPTPQTTRSWAARTPKGFEFSLKLHQKFTHPEMAAKAAQRRADDAGRESKAILDASELTDKDVDEFRAAIDPLADAAKLGALLAQFPASFTNEPAARGYLEWLLEAFQAYPIAVELRHRSFSDDPEGTLKLLGQFGAAWVQIDEPKFRFSIRQNLLPNVRTFYYMRLHGRNAEQWWRHDKSEDRYNYLYSAAELQPFAEAAEAASRDVKKAYLYANNHFSAKSVANAATIRTQLGQPLPGEYPEAFVERYPDLKGLVRILPSRPSDTLV
jgi:uncharacterized protein YecE (DUF72 family)